KLKHNTNQLLPLLGANPDDGLKIGATNTYTTYGFARNPLTTQHKSHGAYYFATNGLELNDKGEFANVIRSFNLRVEGQCNSPDFSLNFFGYGNETQKMEDDFGMNYNRVKVSELSFAPSLVWKAYGGSLVSLGVKYEAIEVFETPNRFVENNLELPKYIFDRNQFASINTKF